MTDSGQEQVSWEKILVDGRIAEILRKLDLQTPLLQQQQAIKQLISNKDLLIATHTGSGKTLSYIIPCIQHVLYQQTSQQNYKHQLQALILEPTTELVLQTAELMRTLCKYFAKQDYHINLKYDNQLERKQYDPDIVITTPQNVQNYEYDYLKYLVIDEADLMFAFDYKEQLNNLLSVIPKNCTKCLCSATLDSEVAKYQELLLVNPLVIKDDDSEEAKHNFFFMTYQQDIEKYHQLFALFSLDLVNGQRSIVYTSKTSEAFRLKYFLEKFGHRPLLFSPQFPLEQRQAQLTKFNNYNSDILVVSGHTTDKEAGVVRGLDFESVGVVVLFSVPNSYEELIHICGRAGRGGQTATIITLIMDVDVENQETKRQNTVLQSCLDNGLHMTYQELNIAKIKENFGYRVRDVWSQMSEGQMKKYRLSLLNQMLLENKEVKSYLQQHKKEQALLKSGLNSIGQKSLKQIPSYLKQVADEIKAESGFSVDAHGPRTRGGTSYSRRNRLLRQLGKK